MADSEHYVVVLRDTENVVASFLREQDLVLFCSGYQDGETTLLFHLM